MPGSVLGARDTEIKRDRQMMPTQRSKYDGGGAVDVERRDPGGMRRTYLEKVMPKPGLCFFF